MTKIDFEINSFFEPNGLKADGYIYAFHFENEDDSKTIIIKTDGYSKEEMDKIIWK